MSNPKPERGTPREPYNIPIRIQGAERSFADDPEYRALLLDVRFLIEDARRRGVLPPPTEKKPRKPRGSKKRSSLRAS